MVFLLATRLVPLEYWDVATFTYIQNCLGWPGSQALAVNDITTVRSPNQQREIDGEQLEFYDHRRVILSALEVAGLYSSP